MNERREERGNAAFKKYIEISVRKYCTVYFEYFPHIYRYTHHEKNSIKTLSLALKHSKH